MHKTEKPTFQALARKIGWSCRVQICGYLTEIVRRAFQTSASKPKPPITAALGSGTASVDTEMSPNDQLIAFPPPSMPV